MGDLSAEDRLIRRRIAAWLKYYYEEEPGLFPTRQSFAKHTHISKSTITDALNGKEDIGIGINVLINMRRYLHAKLDVVFDHDPPQIKRSERSGERKQNPSEASSGKPTQRRHERDE